MMKQDITALFSPESILWLSEDDTCVPVNVSDWLMELGSMTRLFELHCHQVTVELHREMFISKSELSGSEADRLPESERYWLREVILCGDNSPWLLGRTVIPEETLTGNDKALVDLGTVPLGRYLFSNPNLSRDYIRIGKQKHRWARCSRLRLADKPLLLTEIFLPASPVYLTV